jgi:hypothetical protein
MPKTKISEFSSTPANNTDIDSINIAEGCAPSGINDAIRELMAQLKDFQTGAVGDSFNGPIGSTTASTGAFTTVTATSAATTNSEARSVIKLADTSSVAQGNGGGLIFRGVYTGSTLVDAASVQAYKANATDNDYSYGLAFVTRANGGNLTANMKLDQSGNLGLGVTPSAWGSAWKAMQISTFASFGGNNDDKLTAIGNNFYNDGISKYIGTGQAALYSQYQGQHRWLTAASGTAGNAITFTQAMTLDASGNLGIGTTSPASKLDIGGGDSSCQALIMRRGIKPTISNLQASILCELNGIGSSESMTFMADAGYKWLDDAGTTEWMRISSGNLLVGTTSQFQSAKTTVSTNGSNGIASTQTAAGGYCFVANAIVNTGTYFYQVFKANATDTGSITSSGTTTTYGTTSDYRLKKDIQPMTGALAKVAGLNPVTYKWKSSGEQDNGFIAHELQAVCPSAVTGAKDAVDEDGNPQYQSIDTSFLVATLTAAIQEQQAIIESLKTRITALEGQ